MTAPVPLAILPVDELGLDILPTAIGTPKSLLVAKILPQIEPAHYVLGLYPPVQVIVHMSCIEVGLMNHRPVRPQALCRGLCHLANDGFHLCEHDRIAQHKRCLMH